MHGFSHIPSSIGLECLLFPVHWFTRTIRNNNGRTLAITQVEAENRGGQLLWMLPAHNPSEAANSMLLDRIAVEAGRRGLFFLKASVHEDSASVQLLQENGYHMQGWEQVWAYSLKKPVKETNQNGWRKTNSTDLHPLNILQHTIHSPQEKLTEPSVIEKPPQYTLDLNGRLQGYAYVNKGLDSALVTPLVSKDVNDSGQLVLQLANIIFTNIAIMYILQRSNQNWDNSTILESCKNVSGKRIKMVKHLAVREKSLAKEFNPAGGERHSDVVAPTARTTGFKDKI